MEKNKKNKKKTAIIIITVTAVVLALGAAVAAIGFLYHQYLYDSTGSDTYVSEGVYVNDVDLGGMTLDEAQRAMAGIERKLASQVKVDIKVGDTNYHLTKVDFPCSFNTDEVFEQVKAFSAEKGFDKEEQHYEITMQTDTSGIESIAKSFEEELYVAPVDAKVKAFDPDADDMFTYRKEKAGRKLDTRDLIDKLSGIFENGGLSGSVEVKIDEIEPSITVDYLQDHIVKLASFSTTSTNNANGNENMRISLNACSGSIIDPGEVWSFNDCTGDSNLESNGYKPAGVIVEGRSETGVGGGICQSSTTIYNAGLLSGMEVVERYCHYYKSTYVDAGRDATIDYGNLDLKLGNPFDYQLFMKCWMKDTKLTCEIYGLQNPDFDQIKISTSDPENKGKSYTVEAWRTYYLGGEKQWTEDLPESTYYTSAP